MSNDTQTKVYSRGFLSKACSTLIESGLWLKDDIHTR
ncbi:integrase [Yersinia enterocolitica]|nr:integrase [Yersinia enterocolitica]CFQ84911.1 integrase [Yersinia enterocolitica]CNF49528.1 integrase [Yersinia enterocolitica]CNF71015.1 integrase [Yersinia enterocolitica]CNJ00806.1 integrase [Yersinia enterocolitica]